MKNVSARRIFIIYVFLVGVFCAVIYYPLLETKILSIFHSEIAHSKTNEVEYENLSALSVRKISTDEVAVVKKSIDKPTGKKATQSIQLKDGKTISVESDQNAVYSLIEGGSGTNYIKASEDTQVFKVDAIDNKTDEKIEPELARKLKKETVVPVIVRVKVPFVRFYEKRQSTEQGAVKKGQLENAKNNVLKNFSAKSKHKKDLEIVSGFSADVDHETLAKLEKDPNVIKVEFDQQVQATLDSSLDQISVKETWNMVDNAGAPLTGRGKRIAILDTGVDYTHSDLGGCLGASCKVIGGYDFINNDTNPMDDHGHGTHVAATAAGRGLLHGVAPDASILAVKVLSAGGSGSSSQIIAGINYATDPNKDGNPEDHVDVASMSLGGGGNPDDAMSLAVDNSTAAGVTYTIAAGNSGPGASTINSPGTARTAITVAASCKTSQIGPDSRCSGPVASFSSRGPLVYNGVDIQKPDLAAPGVMICAARWGSSFGTSPTCLDSSHVRISGTSMATPHVAGLATLVLQANPSYTPSQVKQTLKSTAKNLNVSTNDQGTGEIDAKKAIPQVAKFAATPSTWTLSSNPANKLSTHQQTFSVVSNDASVSTLDISLDAPVGISLTPSKASLQVTGGQTDSFEAAFTIDNDTVMAGVYLARIVLSENGVAKGSIPVFLTVKPTFTTSVQSIDYGIDNPSLSSWTSDTKTLSVTNLRQDAAQTLAIGHSAFPAGITFQTPSSITVPASGSATVDTKFVVDNTIVPNNIYTGTINLSGQSTSVKVDTKFVKYYVLTVQDPSPNELVSSWVTVHNRNGVNYYDYTRNSPRVFYLNTAGQYDVIVDYLSLYDPASGKYRNFQVVKEGVDVQGASTVVTVNKSDAKNLTKIVPVNSTGTASNLRTVYQCLTYLPRTGCIASSITFAFSDNSTDLLATKYISNLSNTYKFEKFAAAELQPASTLHYFHLTTIGLSDHLTFSNTPSDLYKMDVQWDPDQQSGSFFPLIWGGMGNVSVIYDTAKTLTLPLVQAVYSTTPSSFPANFMARPTSNLSDFYGVDMSPGFSVSDNPFRWIQFAFKEQLPDFREKGVYVGMGPTFWDGRFTNTTTGIKITSYHENINCGQGYGYCAYLFRQDFSRKPHPAFPYSIYKNGSFFYSGQIPAYPGNFVTQLINSAIGKYDFKVDFPYKNKGLDMIGRVVASFDTALTDPNPPSIKRMYVYSGNKRSEVYDPTVVNKVEFEFDPIGGSMGKVGVSYATDGTNFKPLTVTNNNGVYSANITPVSGITKVTVKVVAADNSGNSLSYSFELPVGAGTALQDTEAPTAAIKSPADGAAVSGIVSVDVMARDNFGVSKVELMVDGAPAGSIEKEPYVVNWDSSKASIGNHSLLAKAYDEAGNVTSSSPVTVTVKDTVAPVVTITSPLNGAQVKRRAKLTIAANATDNIGVSKVEITAGGVLLCTDTTSPYSCIWTVPNKPGSYIITAKAYDVNGNNSSQSITVTAK